MTRCSYRQVTYAYHPHTSKEARYMSCPANLTLPLHVRYVRYSPMLFVFFSIYLPTYLHSIIKRIQFPPAIMSEVIHFFPHRDVVTL